ncbi:hypothetical protein D6817_01530, partial [Candidatus Pacearchaeota archaeon]
TELILHPYLIAWFHKLATYFGSQSVEQSAALFPSFFFALAVITFFLMAKEAFKPLGKKQAYIAALVGAVFLSVIPSLMPRTIAGIPEKESSSIPFLFLSFYFFILAWRATSMKKALLFGALAGTSTAVMGNLWGGYIYIPVTLALATGIAFILGQSTKEKTFAYISWASISAIGLTAFIQRYTLRSILTSTTTGAASLVLTILLVDFVLFETRLRKTKQIEKLNKWPRQIVSALTAIVLGTIIVSLIFGPGFIPNKISNLVQNLINPITSRLGVTVAQNRQPYFTEWENSFGPSFFRFRLPITFWTMFLGSIHLFWFALRKIETKDRWKMTLAYAVFLTGLIFSRYNPNSKLNGTNGVSKVVYFGSAFLFLATLVYFYVIYEREKKSDRFRTIDFGLLFVISYLAVSLISARSAVRLIMMVTPSAALLMGYVGTIGGKLAAEEIVKKKRKPNIAKLLAGVFIVFVVAYAGLTFYKIILPSAQNYAPSAYNQQWQKAMAWVRENTPQNAVFGHWWDYGYWVQTIGQRATVLDGGNFISYWNHLMGRYALTGTSDIEALEFLYAHNTTHFLIDSTDIGKYGAFSSIGSDENYDRRSFIPTLLRDPRQTLEKKNTTLIFYRGAFGLDEDIVYELNNTRIFLPQGSAALGGVIVEVNASQDIVSNPVGVFVYKGQQYRIPLRYAYLNGFHDFEKGIEAGVFIFPRAEQQGNQLQVDRLGALLYLSRRTVKSQLARLYLYKEEDPYFKLVHSEDDLFIAQIKQQNPSFPYDFLYFRGFRGPIRIWEIHYPENITFKQEFINTQYPSEKLWRA